MNEINATIIPYELNFKKPSGTSRGILYTKKTYFLKLNQSGKTGYGECNLFKGLSSDDVPDYEKKLQWLTTHINWPIKDLIEALKDYSSIIFGLEQAFEALKARQAFHLYPSAFTEGKKGIPINGLIWMGNKLFMKEQIDHKIKEGYKVIKLKIGAIDFEEELELLKYIRKTYKNETLEIRVDANGAFSTHKALEKLKRLSDYQIHSIEQPIAKGQFEEMAKLCQQSPIPIALDEELIGYNHLINKEKILKTINPQYIIIKPALHGGFIGTETWIKAAEASQTGWWITSALESNIGLNAIAQYTFTKKINRPQGLGTGQLYTNNIESPLEIENGALFFRPDKSFNLPANF